MNNCCMIDCKFKKRYENYCWRHRKYYLVDENDIILYDRFTGEKRDYTKKQLCNTYKKLTNNKNTNKDKDFYFDFIELNHRINEKYNDYDIKIITSMQKNLREKCERVKKN